MNYRVEIDGLRAFAVIPVILFHTGFTLFSGGYIGVDVFFVISGYLITTVLLESLQNKNFSILNFYKKRARRLLPAVYFLLLVCVIYGLFLDPFSARDLYQSILATTFFSENILLLLESNNYFDLSTELKPLVHMWTLGIEEQFYLFFPLLILLSHKFKVLFKFFLFIILFLVSLFLCIYFTNNNVDFAFYSIITRGWELLIGTLTAIYLFYFKSNFKLKYKNLFSIIGFSAIITSIFLFDHTIKFPYFYALLPTMGTSLIIIFTDNKTYLYSLLSNKIFVSIGLISYSLYLWHQPIIAFFQDNIVTLGNQITLIYKPLILLLILLFSLISFYFVEKPLRKGGRVKDKYFYPVILVVTLFLAFTSYYGHKSIGFESFKVNNLGLNRKYYFSQLELVNKAKSIWFDKINNFNPEKSDDILFIGDSMAADAESSLRLNGKNSNIITLDGSCFMSLVKTGKSCGVSIDSLYSIAKKSKVIILASDFTGEKSENGAILLSNLLNKISPTFVIGNFKFKNASKLSYYIAKSNFTMDETKYFFESNINQRIYSTNNKLKAHFKEFYIDKKSVFCHNKGCNLYDDDLTPIFFDEHHMTYRGKEIFGKFLLNEIDSYIR